MTNLAFNIDFLGKLISLNEQEGDEKLLASSFAWYSDTFMIAVHSKDVVKMQGFCDACMLVLDSIVDHDSTATCQLMLISFLVQAKEYIPAKLFSKFRIQALKLNRFLSWLIKEAFNGSSDARLFYEHLLKCDQSSCDEDFLFVQTCMVLAVEIMAGLDQLALAQKSTENLFESPALLQGKVVILKTTFSTCFQCEESSPPRQINFLELEISRESSLNSFDRIIKHLSENALALLQSERTASKFSFRESIPVFSMYGEIMELLSIALKVYQLQRMQDRTHVHFIYALFIILFETAAKMNSVAFMGHAAKVCNEQLLHLLEDSQKYDISNIIVLFLSPKLEQLQTGKISGLSYEGVISIALRLSPPSSNCSELHQMIQSTALLICNREEKIP